MITATSSSKPYYYIFKKFNSRSTQSWKTNKEIEKYEKLMVERKSNAFKSMSVISIA